MKTILFLLALYLISFASVVASGYLIYVNEYKSKSTPLVDENGNYEGAELPPVEANKGAAMA